eukprot:PITA_33938
MLDTKLTKSRAFHPQTDGQTEVFNRMIVHNLCMYNSKHPHTWDESLPYVQHNYNRALHSSTGHNPFQVGNKVWLHLQKERLIGAYPKLKPLQYGPYTIIKAVGDNAFELSIPPFLGLHPVFNVDYLWPYFPPLLDTSDIVEQLTPTELNPDCMDQAATDRIMDTQIKHTCQQNIQLYRVVKAGQLHYGKWLTRDQVQ